jgi:hypothetical protein
MVATSMGPSGFQSNSALRDDSLHGAAREYFWEMDDLTPMSAKPRVSAS